MSMYIYIYTCWNRAAPAEACTVHKDFDGEPDLAQNYASFIVLGGPEQLVQLRTNFSWGSADNKGSLDLRLSVSVPRPLATCYATGP